MFYDLLIRMMLVTVEMIVGSSKRFRSLGLVKGV